MKKNQLLLMCLSLVFAISSYAQDAESPSRRGLSLSVGPEFALPIGSFKDAGYKFGAGGSAKLVIPVSTMLDVTASAGYIVFGASKLDELNDNGALNFIPFKGGLRVRTAGGFYAEPQAGITQMKAQNVSEGSANFTYALNLGYLINNMVDIGLRYEAVAPKEGTSSKMLGLRLAYNFNFARVR